MTNNLAIQVGLAKGCAEQDADPELFLAKQQATALYADWMNELADYEEVKALYLAADAICISKGWKFLEAMPMTGNFIPERYSLLGDPL